MIKRSIFLCYDPNIDSTSEWYGTESNYSDYGTQSTSASSLAGSAVMGTTSEVTYTLNAAAMAVLFSGVTTNPVKMEVRACGCCSANSSSIYVGVKIGTTYVKKWQQAQTGSALSPSFPSNAVTTGEITPPVTLTQSSKIILCAKKQRSTQWVGIDNVEITLWFDEEVSTKTVSVVYNGQALISAEVDASSTVTVVYNGRQLSTGAATLKCSGKIMAGDVTVAGKTLKCSGKIMAGDITIQIT